jgi:hypothetical protein
MRRVSLAFLPALLVCTACGADSEPPESDEVTPAEVAAWAPNVSALGAYLSIYGPVAAYDGQAAFGDPTCPAVQRDESTLTITGGCTDSSGMNWTGLVSMSLATNTLSFASFGSGQPSVTTQSGTATLADGSTTSRDYSIELAGSDGSSISYQGHVDGAYGARTVWSGSGTFVRHAGQTNGQADALTTDEVYDDSECGSAPAAGTTQISLRNHAAVVTYEGAVDCGADTADVTIDGAPQGKLSGIDCGIAPDARAHGRAATYLALLLGVAGAWLGRRSRGLPRA